MWSWRNHIYPKREVRVVVSSVYGCTYIDSCIRTYNPITVWHNTWLITSPRRDCTCVWRNWENGLTEKILRWAQRELSWCRCDQDGLSSIPPQVKVRELPNDSDNDYDNEECHQEMFRNSLMFLAMMMDLATIELFCWSKIKWLLSLIFVNVRYCIPLCGPRNGISQDTTLMWFP
jgi:hypothetical protein